MKFLSRNLETLGGSYYRKSRSAQGLAMLACVANVLHSDRNTRTCLQITQIFRRYTPESVK